MNYKYKRKKGVSLIEVIISVAILVILIIPLANSVIQSIIINKTSERKQMASFEGQKVLEEFESYKNLTLNGGIFNLLNGKPMKQDTTNKDKYEGEFSYEKGRDKYNVKVLMEKDNNLKSKNANGNPAFTINLPESGKLITEKKGSDEIRKEDIYTDATDIDVEISNNEGRETKYTIKITIKSPTSSETLEYSEIENLNTDKILLKIGKDYTSKLNINIDNKAEENSANNTSGTTSTKVNVIANIEQADDERARGIIDIESTSGDVVIRKDRNVSLMEKIGDLYNINVQVELNNKVLFESSEAQNIEIK
jgi:prepilin-type N-terminal cleavage/methylation domain-containing protein